MSRETSKIYDTPLSEHDCQVFLDFYNNFLGQSEDDSLNVLKTLTLMRQNRRRLVIHNLVAARKLAEEIFPDPETRKKILTYPSILENIWQQVLEYKRNFSTTNFPIQPLQQMIANYLLQIDDLSNQLEEVLKKTPSIQPKDKFNLSIAFASTGELKQQKRAEYQWLLIALANHPFLCILPADATDSTMALGKLRNYLNQMFGDQASSMYIEFFVMAGGYLKRTLRVELSGRNPLFEISFSAPNLPSSHQVVLAHHNAKFNLAYEILNAEFPLETFFWETIE
ncbi:MAG: hypothetical protein HY819_16080 [Acidobacteria bacterium]|nr:hypothetical protein [Acidobacteriota bacterium]